MKEKIAIQLGNVQKEARDNVKGMLARSPAFNELGTHEQLGTYRDLVDAEYNRLVDKRGLRALARQQAEGDAAPFDAVQNRAGQMIGIQQIGESFGSMVRQVDFPKFVKDLVQAVYDANINLTKTQMQMFSDMLKEVTGSLQKFINKIDDTESFAYLVANEPNRYGMITERDPATGQNRPIMIDQETLQKLDENDNEFKAKVMDAKIKMAQEHRAMLRETILMGVSRIVITSGKVKAKVHFTVAVADHLTGGNVRNSEDNTNLGITNEVEASGGWGPFSASVSNTVEFQRETKLVVNTTSNIDSTQNGAAELMGEVELNFKSDYFKLDNFKDMFPTVANPGTAPANAPASLPPTPPRQ
jgi:hypothetical protein